MVQPKLRFKRDDGKEYPSLFECSIKDVSSIKNGPFGSVLHSSDYVLEGTPIITTEHFKSGIIQSDVSTIPKVSEEDYKRLKGYVLETGDIVFSRVGSIDINALVTERENGWLFSGRVIRVRLNSSYHSGYFHYLLSTQRVKNDIVARAVGQTMPSINSEILNSTSLMITTSYEEQQKIADFLSSVDEVIAQSEAEVQILEQQKKAAMQKIFLQEVRFRREDGTEYPEWKESAIRECLNYEQPTNYIVHSGNYSNDFDIPVLTANKGFILGYTDEQDGHYDKGDVIIYDDFTMDMKFVRFKFKVKSSAMKMLTAKTGTDLYFIYSLLCSLNLHQNVHSRSYISQVEPMIVFIPCLEEQQKIATFLSAYDEAIACSKQELDKWKELKKGLLQQMFV